VAESLGSVDNDSLLFLPAISVARELVVMVVVVGILGRSDQFGPVGWGEIDKLERGLCSKKLVGPELRMD
jgi:hypothetical protein